MPQGVRRHVGETGERADPIEHTHDADEVACAPIGGEEAGEGIRTPEPNLGQAAMLIGTLAREPASSLVLTQHSPKGRKTVGQDRYGRVVIVALSS